MGHRAISVTSLGKRRQVGNYGNAYNDRPPSPSRAQNLVLAQLYTYLGSTWYLVSTCGQRYLTHTSNPNHVWYHGATSISHGFLARPEQLNR